MSGFFTLIYSLNLMIVAGVVATVGSGAAAAAAASALSFSYGAPAVHTIVPQHGSPRGGACTQANVLFLQLYVRYMISDSGFFDISYLTSIIRHCGDCGRGELWTGDGGRCRYRGRHTVRANGLALALLVAVRRAKRPRCQPRRSGLGPIDLASA